MSASSNVLNFCNKVRVEKDLKPVRSLAKGERLVASNCPIANTIGQDAPYRVLVSPMLCTLVDGNVGIEARPVPQFVRDWIREFDNGKHNRYLIKEA